MQATLVPIVVLVAIRKALSHCADVGDRQQLLLIGAAVSSLDHLVVNGILVDVECIFTTMLKVTYLPRDPRSDCLLSFLLGTKCLYGVKGLLSLSKTGVTCKLNALQAHCW